MPAVLLGLIGESRSVEPALNCGGDIDIPCNEISYEYELGEAQFHMNKTQRELDECPQRVALGDFRPDVCEFRFLVQRLNYRPFSSL